MTKNADLIFDGGIRTGADIIKALALGANAVSLGCAYIYGLGAGGKAGVMQAINILKTEMDSTMALMGVTSIQHLQENGRELVNFRPQS